MLSHFSVIKHWKMVLFSGLLSFLLLALWLKDIDAYHKPYPLPWSPAKIVYGVNVDITAMIPDTPYTVKTANGGNFFDLATRLGINTLRITDVQWANTGRLRTQESWEYVMNEAKTHHLNIILLLVDGGKHTALQEAHTLLGDYGLAHAPALWMVDLDNEPDVSNAKQMARLRAEAAYVHKVAPKVPVTIGGWKSEIAGKPGTFDWEDPADIPSLIDLVDVVSPHLYGFERDAERGITPAQATRNFLSAVRQQARGKPILLEEFGAGNGLATTTAAVPTGSPEWQASVYRDVLQEVSAEHEQGIIGAVAWIVSPRPAWPNSDSYQGNMAGWAFVLDNGRRLLPAAQEFLAVGRTESTELSAEKNAP